VRTIVFLSVFAVVLRDLSRPYDKTQVVLALGSQLPMHGIITQLKVKGLAWWLNDQNCRAFTTKLCWDGNAHCLLTVGK
jgi:hypothetical protein